MYKPSLKTAAREETEGGTRLNHVETKIKSLRIKNILEVMEDKNKFPLFEYYKGLKLINIKKLDNNTPHWFRPPDDEFLKSINKNINNVPVPNKAKTKNIYRELIEELDKTEIRAMEHLYRYTIVDPAEAFEELVKTQNSNIVKHKTLRLLYNSTPIRPLEKCTMCQKKATKTHLYVYCREIKDIKRSI